MKSNLNLPLKFLILLVSSCLPNAAIEVASLSKYLFDAIPITFAKTVSISRIHVIGIVLEVCRLNFGNSTGLRTGQNWLVIDPIFFCYFAGRLITSGHEDR